MVAAEPYTDDDEALAESLVDQAVGPYSGVLPTKVLEDMREAMVDELLATEEGRRKLRVFKQHTSAAEPSADVEIHPSIVAEREKARGGK